MSKISDFHRGETKRFDVYITVDGEVPSLINDTLTIRLKTQKGGTQVIEETADVTTQGAGGIAKFVLTPTVTDVSHGKYYYEIEWNLDTEEVFIVDEGTISILERV